MGRAGEDEEDGRDGDGEERVELHGWKSGDAMGGFGRRQAGPQMLMYWPAGRRQLRGVVSCHGWACGSDLGGRADRGEMCESLDGAGLEGLACAGDGVVVKGVQREVVHAGRVIGA